MEGRKTIGKKKRLPGGKEMIVLQGRTTRLKERESHGGKGHKRR